MWDVEALRKCSLFSCIFRKKIVDVKRQRPGTCIIEAKAPLAASSTHWGKCCKQITRKNTVKVAFQSEQLSLPTTIGKSENKEDSTIHVLCLAPQYGTAKEN